MDNHNPYAPSRASLVGAAVAPADGGGVWRDGAVLVLSREALLPGRCVRCNEPAEEPTKSRRVYWHSPWIYLLIIINLLIYLVVALIVRKKAVVAPGLCSAHKRRRLVGIAMAWTLLLAGIALLFIGGTLVIVAALVVSVSVARVLRPKRIDAQYVRLKGCGVAFLDSMPPFPG
jgi:hypothetical protein